MVLRCLLEGSFGEIKFNEKRAADKIGKGTNDLVNGQVDVWMNGCLIDVLSKGIKS